MTHPQDRQLARDIFTGSLLLVLAMLAYTSLYLNGSISPADECANTVKEQLSPFQAHRLTGAEFPLLPRQEVVSWCSRNVINWERDIESARSFAEFPHHLDMIID